MAPLLRDPGFRRRLDDHRVEELLRCADECADLEQRNRLLEEAVILSLDLADAVAHRYSGRGMDIEDLTQVARMGLVKAVHRYRSGAGFSFTGYAIPTIAGELKRHFRDHGWAVRPPRRLQELRLELASVEARLQQELHREPAPDEIAETLGVTTEEVRECRLSQTAYTAFSLDVPVDGESGPVEAPPAPSDDFAVIDQRDALRRALATLNDRDRRLLHLRFVDDLTQSQIGEIIGVSQMQVSRLLSDILRRLRDALETADMESARQREPVAAVGAVA
jgi:RNA polymerase sigma-B factor